MKPREAIILAGGKAERLGEAAHGKPKPLIPICGRPLVSYQITGLREAGVERVILACAAGQGDEFAEGLQGLGVEIVPVEEPEPLGRGGGIRFAAKELSARNAVFAMNGDELLDVDLSELYVAHRASGALATVTVSPLVSPFGLVELRDDGFVSGFSEEAPKLPHWVNIGLYVLEPEAIHRFPERGDHERTTFPELAREGLLYAFRYEGVWLTVNTPKQLRLADEYVSTHPGSLGWSRLPDGMSPGRKPGKMGAPGNDPAIEMANLSSPNFEGLDAFAFKQERVDKPWGWEQIWAKTDQYAGKILFVRAGQAMSLQFHNEKDETWYFQSGRAEVELAQAGDSITNREIVGPGAAFHLKPGTVHRLRAIEDTTVFEVSTTQLDDVVRLEDLYGRADA